MLRAVVQSKLVTTIKAEIGINILNLVSAEVKSLIIGGSYERYTDDYVITPTLEEQLLETNHRLMMDNVTILPIPVQRFENEYGGETVIIG